jgi:hypothetical protein
MEMRFVDPKIITTGDSIIVNASFFDPDDQPLDITGAAIEWAMGVLGQTPLLTASIGTNITVTGNPVDGKALIQINPPYAVGVGTYTQQARVVLPDGTSSVQFEGPIQINASFFGGP